MAYDVTSSFVARSREKKPGVVRQLTLAGSDYSDRVMQWPKFNRTWDEIRPRTLQIKLANGDQAMNFLREDKTLLQNIATISMGFTHPNSADELIDLFAGKMRGVSYADETCILSIVDKFQQLSERKIGDSDVPVEYVGSNYLPSDLAWWAVTSFGGYSVNSLAANPDIDVVAFDTWANVFSQDTVFMQARFDGQKVTEVLRKIARHTNSAIFIKENKLSFHRFGIADAAVSSLGPDQLRDVKLSFDTNDIINKQYVAGDYDPTSDFHQFTVVDVGTASVNSFGIKEQTLKDNNLWYVDSASAINLAQRLILVNKEPDDAVDLMTGLVGLPRLIGETLTIQDAFHSITESYRILEHTIDMDKGLTNFKIDRTQITGLFILDTSSLDSTTDVLT